MARARNGISSMKTVRTFFKVGSCSEALCNVLDRAFEHPLKLEEHASMPLAGGIMQRGYQCGMLWGAALAAGAQAYRLHGPGPQAETGAIVAAQRLVESFLARNKSIDCFEITDTKWHSSMQVLRYFIKGGPIGCFHMATKYAPAAFSEINAALSETHIEPPSPPVSCAAMLARKVGASDMHTVMAAGFAGGIGLCGGGCGALGAAIWIIGMNSGQGRAANIDFKDPKALDAIERFLKCTGDKFECSEIVGRRFENVDDHAGYMRDGGCAAIIEALTAE
ncbi:MAG: C-GCAxxG-C-C family protein [Candidatus Cloacimonetes bacterium]|nr:C-GCAxxG-C-C family protein [Candidatus Cloacimonadota bacterium]